MGVTKKAASLLLSAQYAGCSTSKTIFSSSCHYLHNLGAGLCTFPLLLESYEHPSFFNEENISILKKVLYNSMG